MIQLPRVSPAGGTSGAATLQRRARTALVVNLIVAVGLFGLLSVPGAISAGLALRALPDHPDRADRLVTWAWAFLAANLVFYVLLAAVVATVVLLVFLGHRAAGS